MLRFTSPIFATGHHAPGNAIVNGLFFAMLMAFASESALGADVWPQWRGPDQNGFASRGEYPVKWDEQTHILWKTPIQGNGSSTPVVSGSTAYVTAGIDGKNSLIAVSMDDGSPKWTISIGKDRGGKHRKGGGSNPSAVIKDDLVYAYFRSGDLACVDKEGSIVWELNTQEKYGEDNLQWDLGTSPLLTDHALVIAVMQRESSYVVAFDLLTGERQWKVDRNLDAPKEANDSYATPLSVVIDGEEAVIDGKEAIAVMGADHLTIYDAEDGTLMGKVGGLNPGQVPNFRSIASPVASGDIVVCPYSRGDTVTAIGMQKTVAGEGENSVVWFRDDVGSDVPTPAIAGDQVIFVGGSKKQRGTVSSLDLQTGKTRWSLQVPLSRHDFTSSPLVAGDHVYITGEDGTTHVIGPINNGTPSLISSNKLDDDEPFTKASPVAVGNSILIRTKSFLYRIGS